MDISLPFPLPTDIGQLEKGRCCDWGHGERKRWKGPPAKAEEEMISFTASCEEESESSPTWREGQIWKSSSLNLNAQGRHLFCTQHPLHSISEPAGTGRDVGLHTERHSGTPPDLKTDIDKEKYPKKCTYT